MCFMPACIWRRYSWCTDATWRTTAIRSGTWSSAPHAAHQARMSSSLGLRAPFSILLTFVWWMPEADASSRAVSLASLRISRRRAPSDSRACWTGVVNSGGVVLAVRDSDSPRLFEGGRTPAEKRAVGGELVALDLAVSGEVGEHDRLGVEAPEVVAR